MAAQAIGTAGPDRGPRSLVTEHPTLLVAMVIGLLLLLGFGATAWLSYQDEIEKTERDTRNLALVLKEHASRTTHAVDITLEWTARALLVLEAVGAGPKNAAEMAAFLA